MSATRTGWKHRFIVSGLFHADHLTVAEKAEKIAARIRRQRWFDKDDFDIVGVVEELERFAAEGTDDADEFDGIWSAFYDWCDAERVWVVTR